MGCLGLVLSAARPACAQTPADTAGRQLDAQLRRLEVSPLLRVVQAREALVAELRHNRAGRLPGLLDYLLQQLPAVDSSARLSVNERALLLAAAGRFAALLKQAVPARAYFGRDCRVPFRTFPADGLAEAAQAFVARRADSLIRVAARRVRQPAADSAFLPLYLRVLANGREEVSDSLDAGLRRFVQRYPASPLAGVAKWYVRYEFVPSPFTVGGEFFLGGTFFQGELSEAFTNTVRLGMGGEASWQRYLLYARLTTGDLRPRATYTFGQAVWEPEQSLNYSQVELSAGYCVLENKWLRLTPFAGASLLWFAPATVNNQPVRPEADYRLWFARPLTAGLNLEIKLDKDREHRFGRGPLSDSNWTLRLRSGWRQAQAQQGPPTAGGVYYVEAGLGIFVRMAGTRR
ncbi:hypothetical protein Q5H92_16910 [Hymenobacter sp. M29]|uniref:Uncharacterized protein n=1 Tax=Hymenobacter mellowenesis TaxID=3063995 RepID=A0ABT9ADV7_9BACT|nr:hypothetical protein [Hymenobacter sp. M29]MDO7848048.1 hypothetical protein [Hymenobacter sp. M29]